MNHYLFYWSLSILLVVKDSRVSSTADDHCDGHPSLKSPLPKSLADNCGTIQRCTLMIHGLAWCIPRCAIAFCIFLDIDGLFK